MERDLVIKGGAVLDGTGSPADTADVAVADGRIVEVGRVTGAAKRIVDADGAVVCPGFIDLHSHTDFTIFGAPGAITQATQGVTTLVTGNCGFSPFPITPEHADEFRASAAFLDDGLTWDWSTATEYAAAVNRLPLGVNLALLVGHGTVRIAAMGAAERAPTEAELDRMRALVRESLAAGAVGFSTGLVYAPGMYGSPAEITALAGEVAAADALYSTHMRDEGDRLLEAIDEALTVSRRVGVRLEISHLKAAGEQNWGKVQDALGRIDAARQSGVDVTADQYPYPASSTTLTSFLPAWAMDGGVPALGERLADETVREQIAADVSVAGDRIVLADLGDGPYRGFVGRTVRDVGESLGMDDAHAAVELLRGHHRRLGIVHHSMSEDDVRTVLRHEAVSVASDSHTPGCPGRGRPHPRGLGTFTRVLGHYVRTEGVVGLADAVRKMTSLPASRLGWTDRGVLRPGAVADLTIVDPAAVTDNATFDEPWQLSTGVLHTFVRGIPTLSDGQPTAFAPGTVL